MVMKHHTALASLLALGMLALAACSGGPNPATPDSTSMDLNPQPGVVEQPAVPTTSPAQQEALAAISKTAEGFVEAFHKGDAKAVAAFWTPDGDYVDLEGHLYKGRSEIERQVAQVFAERKGMKLRIEIGSVRLLSPESAIEDGVTSVIMPDGSLPSRSRYTNVLVKQDGKWFLASVREAPYIPPSNYEFLRGLDWTIGEWADDSPEGSHIGHVTFEWTPDENYIVSMRAVQVKNDYLDNGVQRIGWDAAAKRVRSWTFEADGGFGESTWTQDGDKWVIKSTSVLRSGGLMTATNTVTRIDADHITWQSKDQKLNGKALPDTPVIKMKRVK